MNPIVYNLTSTKDVFSDSGLNLRGYLTSPDFYLDVAQGSKRQTFNGGQGQMQATAALWSIGEMIANNGPVTVTARKKASYSQLKMSSAPQMGGSLNGYFQPSTTMTLGTVAAVGALGYVAYKYFRK